MSILNNEMGRSIALLLWIFTNEKRRINVIFYSHRGRFVFLFLNFLNDLETESKIC